MHTVTYLEAMNEALTEEMERDETVFVMGEDVSWSLMGVTGGLVERFGRERVRDTPISEAGFVGAGAGAAMVGMRPVVHMLIAPFVYVAFDQIVSIIAKSTYLYGWAGQDADHADGAHAVRPRQRRPALRPPLPDPDDDPRPEAHRASHAL